MFQDLDNTLDTLIEAAARYDRRQLGPAGLKAWEVGVPQYIKDNNSIATQREYQTSEVF